MTHFITHISEGNKLNDDEEKIDAAKNFIDDFSEQNENAGAKTDEQGNELTPSDVRHAFRWLLGREIDDEDAISKQIVDSGGLRSGLRTRLLRSPEFAGHLNRFAIVSAEAHKKLAKPVDDSFETPKAQNVFVHVPKTGGSSIHQHLLDGLPDIQFCPYRHNTILARSSLDVANYELYSGHYDRRVLSVIPNVSKTFTILREPKSRLISVYRYLRSTRHERAYVEGHDLAQLARNLDIRSFILEARRINAGTVDNTYIRCFGSQLPVARWETRAELAWTDTFGKMSADEMSAALYRAKQTLLNFTYVGTLDCMPLFLTQLQRELGFEPIEKPYHFKKLDDISPDTVGFEPVERVEFPDDPEVKACVEYDLKLYQYAKSLNG